MRVRLPSFATTEKYWLSNFTVAKAMQIDILQDIRAALQDALENGTTFDQFKKDPERCVVINADQSVDDIRAQITDVVNERLLSRV